MRRSSVQWLWAVPLVGLIVPAHAQSTPPAAASSVVDLPAIEIVQTSPLIGSGIDISKIPSSVSIVTDREIARRNSPNIEDAIQQNVPGAMTSNQSGSPFQ